MTAQPTCRICGQATLWGTLYCSYACKGIAQRTRPVVPCGHCGAIFTARINRQGNRARFCSRRCANRAMPWKGERLVATRWADRRKFAWAIEHPACRRCGTTDVPHSAHGLCTRCERHERHRRLYTPRPRRRVDRSPPPVEPLPLVWPYVPDSLTLSDDSLLQRVNRLLPLGLGADIRADVGQALVLAVLEGQVAVEDLPRELPVAIKRIYRETHGPWGARSIDAPIAGTDLYLRDVLADPASLSYGSAP